MPLVIENVRIEPIDALPPHVNISISSSSYTTKLRYAVSKLVVGKVLGYYVRGGIKCGIRGNIPRLVLLQGLIFRYKIRR